MLRKRIIAIVRVPAASDALDMAQACIAGGSLRAGPCAGEPCIDPLHARRSVIGSIVERRPMSRRETEKPVTRSFLGTMIAIAWSFIGLRRKKDFDQDVGGLNPAYVIIGALIGAALFIAILLTVVHFVTS